MLGSSLQRILAKGVGPNSKVRRKMVLSTLKNHAAQIVTPFACTSAPLKASQSLTVTVEASNPNSVEISMTSAVTLSELDVDVAITTVGTELSCTNKACYKANLCGVESTYGHAGF